MRGSFNLKWLQEVVQHLCDLFRIIELKPNTTDIEVVIFRPGEIWDVCSDTLAISVNTSMGESYQIRKRWRLRNWRKITIITS